MLSASRKWLLCLSVEAVVSFRGDSIVRLGEIALVSALPMTPAEVRSDLVAFASPDARDVRGDYAAGPLRHVCLGTKLSAIDKNGQHNQLLSRVANTVKGLLAELNESDLAHYAPAATSADLYKASVSKAKVIIVIAHWRESEIRAVDVRPGLLGELHKNLPEAAAHVQASLDVYTFEDPVHIADALNTWVSDLPGEEIARRTLLEHCAPAHLVPGNCLELRNGFHKAEDLLLQLDSSWSGVIELCVCHSEYLALILKDGRSDRHIITNAIAKKPFRVLPELREALLLASIGPIPYIQTRQKIFEAYTTGAIIP